MLSLSGSNQAVVIEMSTSLLILYSIMTPFEAFEISYIIFSNIQNLTKIF